MDGIFQNTSSNPVRVAMTRKHFILSDLYNIIRPDSLDFANKIAKRTAEIRRNRFEFVSPRPDQAWCCADGSCSGHLDSASQV
jgi:hypothetical protein